MRLRHGQHTLVLGAPAILRSCVEELGARERGRWQTATQPTPPRGAAVSLTESTATQHADELVTGAVTEALPGGMAVGQELYLPTPQAFDSVEEERAHRKAKLAAAFRMFSKAGLDEGVAGHVTVRDPEFPDSYWVNPFGMHFSMIKSSDLVRVDHAGNVVEGNRAVNGAAVAIHCAVHAARPDVVAAAHAHGPYGKTLSSLDMTIEPLTQDACAF